MNSCNNSFSNFYNAACDADKDVIIVLRLLLHYLFHNATFNLMVQFILVVVLLLNGVQRLSCEL